MPTDNDTTASVQAAGRAFSQAATRVRESLSAALVRAECRRLASRVSDGISFLDHQVGGVVNHKEHTEQFRSFHSRQARIDRVLARLNGQADATTSTLLAQVSQQILQETASARTDLLVAELTTRVQQANDRAHQRRRDTAGAEALIVQLEGLAGGAVTAARAALNDVVANGGPLTTELQERSRRAAEAAVVSANQAYAAEVIADALTALGYAVEEGFETAFVSGGVAIVQKHEWPQHALRVRTGAGTNVIDLRLVRTAVDSSSTVERAVHDREMEERWCSDYERLRTEIEREGVVCETLRHMAPGAVPVPTVTPAEIPAAASRKPAARQVKR